jgi:hypothetical protein
VRNRAATADSADFENEGGFRALLRRALGHRPLDIVAVVLLLIASGAIVANALYRQPGPHPAPIFSIKPRPVVVEPAEIVPPMPRAKPAAIAKPEPTPIVEAPRPAPVAKPEVKPDIAAPAPVASTPLPRSRPDPIADMIAKPATSNPATSNPASRIAVVQKALSDFGYGPVKATGIHGNDTTAAISKFERERRMPVTGQISPRLLKELSALTGKVIE